MLKKLTALFLALFACSAFAEGFQILPDGRIQAGNTIFRLSVFRKNWSTADQGVKGVAVYSGDAVKTDTGMKFSGKFYLTGDSAFDLTELIDKRSEQELRVQCMLSASEKIATQLFTYKTYLPLANYDQNPVTVDGKQHLLNGKDQVSMDGKVIQIPVKNGVVEIDGPRKRQVMLTREGGNVRVCYVFGYPGYTKASVDMTLKFILDKTAHERK